MRRFGRIGVGPGVMNRAWGVLRGRVDRVELKLIRPDVDEVVTGARRYVDEPACRDTAVLAVQDRLAFAGREDEDLVDIVVRLLADLAIGRDTHHDDLAVRSRRDDLAKVPVLRRSLDDVFVEGHVTLLVAMRLGDAGRER